MPAANYNAAVLANGAAGENVMLLTARWDETTPAPACGQFYMLRAWKAEEAPLLSRPISVHRFDREKKEISFLYEVRGTGTQKLAALRPGDTVALTGPSGRGFPVDGTLGGAVALVGGGIGTAPLLQLCKELAAAGCKPELYCGFRDEPYGLEDFLPYCAAISIATDSGAVGYHGLVTGILHPEQFAMVLTCGPMVMMRGVYQLCAQSGTPCVASLERKMACGLGACLGCTCRTKVGAKTVCKDGPVFKAEEVFD